MNDNKELFRVEAIEAAARRADGATLYGSSPSIILIGVAAVSIAAIVVALGLTTRFSQKFSVQGQLAYDKGQFVITAGTESSVASSHVKVDSRVLAGDMMYLLRTDKRSVSGVDSRDYVEHSIESEISRQRHDRARLAEASKLESKQLILERQEALARIESTDAQIAIEVQKRNLQMNWLKKLQELESQGFFSPIYLRTAQLEVHERDGAIVALSQAKDGLYAKLKELQLNGARLPMRLAEQQAKVDEAIYKLSNELIEKNVSLSVQIVAPASGRVTATYVEPGQEVTASTPLAALVPTGAKLVAVATTNSRPIGLVRPGQPVVLRVSAFPFEQFGLLRGTVEEVQPLLSPINSAANIVPAASPPSYQIRIAIVRDEQSSAVAGNLLSGMEFEADIITGRRSIGQWIMSPITALINKPI